MGQQPSSVVSIRRMPASVRRQTPVKATAATAPISAAAASVAPKTDIVDVGSTEYKDPVTGRTHKYSVGENVILVGAALKLAKDSGYAPLGRIVSLGSTESAPPTTTTTMTVPAGRRLPIIQFYTPAEPSEEGGIGVPAIQREMSLVDSVQPLPFEFGAADLRVLVHNSQIFTCERINDLNPAGCDSCDPSGQLYGPETYADRVNQVFNMVTKVRGGPGSTRYTLFACPATIIRAGQPVSVANTLCKIVIVATITGSTNTNRYSLISTMDPIAFRAAFLYTYGLPVDDVSYYRAVRWTRIPEYQQLLSQLQGERIACMDVDAGWLDTHIRNLLAKGYEAREISLLAGEAPGRKTRQLLTTGQQQALQQMPSVQST